MRHANQEIIFEGIIKEMNEIKPDIIQKSFKNCDIFDKLDGKGDY